jgi:hypothetical protein
VPALRVTATGLHDYVAACASAAASVVATPLPQAHGNFRSSAAAVRDVHAEVALAAQRMSGRLIWTGETARVAAAAYETQDQSSAARVGSLTFGAREA